MEVNLNYLRALTKLAAKNDIRRYLNSVLLEKRGTDLYYVATDGHKLGVFHETTTYQDADFEMIIPLETCLLAKPASKGTTQGILAAGEDGKYSIHAPGNPVTLHFTPIDAKFPDWRKILPEQPTKDGKAAQFNSDYLAAFKRCLEIALAKKDCDYPDVFPNGTAPAVVTGVCEDFYGVIMPMTGGKSVAPAWVGALFAPSAVFVEEKAAA